LDDIHIRPQQLIDQLLHRDPLLFRQTGLSLVHLPPMTHFQNNQLRSGMFHSVDNSIIADSILVTSLPFIALQCLVLDKFCVFPNPFQFIEQTRPCC